MAGSGSSTKSDLKMLDKIKTRKHSFLETFQEQDLKELEDIKQDLAKSINLKSDTLGKSESFKMKLVQTKKGNSFER